MLWLKGNVFKFLILLAGASLNFVACNSDEEVHEPVADNAAHDAAQGDVPARDAVLEQFSSDKVYFAFDSSHITNEGESHLNSVAGLLKKSPTLAIQAEGYCDERGTAQYNLALGERRAQAVKKYLVNLGVEASRITTISYGDERPAVVGHNEAAWSKNRRVEFTVSHQ